jgi:hypothetical protein
VVLGVLQVFHLDIAYVCNNIQVFSGVFASVSDICFMCFVYLLCMLQLLHLNVSKVDWGLPMGCVWEAADGAGDVRGRVGDV